MGFFSTETTSLQIDNRYFRFAMADNEGANGRASARVKTVPGRAAAAAAATASGNAGSILPRGGPAVAMVVVVSAALSAVVYAHYSQVRDKAVMRAGVERDKERLRLTRQQ
jgi:hypothetical protein